MHFSKFLSICSWTAASHSVVSMKAYPTLSGDGGALFLKWALNHKRLRTEYKAKSQLDKYTLCTCLDFSFCLVGGENTQMPAFWVIWYNAEKKDGWVWSLPVKYEWNPGWQWRWGLWLSNNKAEHFCPPLWSCPDLHSAQPPYQVSTMRSSLAMVGGVIEDVPVEAAHISQQHTLPPIQACGSWQASKTNVHSTTIIPQQEGQEGLRQQKLAGGVLCPFFHVVEA